MRVRAPLDWFRIRLAPMDRDAVESRVALASHPDVTPEVAARILRFLTECGSSSAVMFQRAGGQTDVGYSWLTVLASDGAATVAHRRRRLAHSLTMRFRDQDWPAHWLYDFVLLMDRVLAAMRRPLSPELEQGVLAVVLQQSNAEALLDMSIPKILTRVLPVMNDWVVQPISVLAANQIRVLNAVDFRVAQITPDALVTQLAAELLCASYGCLPRGFMIVAFARGRNCG